MFPKRLFLIRHGQSTHNVYEAANGSVDGLADHWDAPLTPLGEAQASDLAKRVKELEVDAIVVSPLSRALQTAIIGFDSHTHLPWIVHPLCRERLDNGCDMGRPKSELEQAFPQLDFSHVPEIWWCNPHGHETLTACQQAFEREFWMESTESVSERIAAFKEYLRSLPHKNIAVVGHSSFLRDFQQKQYKMDNCAIEIFELPHEGDGTSL